jgi:RNA polymerase sigma factor (sigma-70 family)
MQKKKSIDEVASPRISIRGPSENNTLDTKATTKKASEQTLWESFSNGDEAAYDQLYLLSFTRLYNYGMKLCHQPDLVKDAIHDLFIDLWKSYHKARQIQAIVPYQYKALRNIILKTQSQSTSSVSLEHAHDFTFDSSMETKLILQESKLGQMKNLQAALESLTKKQREVIFLKFFEQLNYDEVAHILGISTKAAYKLVGRALAFLREKMHFLIFFMFFRM